MNEESAFSRNLIRRLVQVKQLFLHGKGHSLRAGDFDKLQAILSLDQAVELFLCTVITELGGEFKGQDNFYCLLEKADYCTKEITKKREQAAYRAIFTEPGDNTKEGVNKIVERGLPLKSEIKISVHVLRNGVQHSGLIPSPVDFLLAMNYAEKFLRDSFRLCFEKNFDEIFLADAIIYEDVSQFFREAEEALSKDDLQETIIGLSKSFKFLRRHMEKNLPWDDSFELMLNSNPYQVDPDQIKSTIEMIKYVDFKVNLLASGVNLQDYKLLIEKAPVVNVSQGGNITGVHFNARCGPATEKEVNRMFNFVYNMALHCQSFE